MTTPTITQMVKVYVQAAAVERLKCGRPNEGTVRNTLSGVRTFARWLNARRDSEGYERFDFAGIFGGTKTVLSSTDSALGTPHSAPSSPLVSIIKPQLIHSYLADMLERKMKPVTAMSYVTQFQQLFARWVRPYYEDRGWKIPPFPAFGKRPIAPRYNRPSKDQLRRVKAWYESIDNSRRFQARYSLVPGDKLWFAATMMLEFAMRNSDITRLTRENFVEYEGRVFLNYTPHKTQHSSGRMVKWPIHEKIWKRLTERGDLYLPELTEDVFDALNREMRSLGFTGTKGAYELRKICIDHVYQRFGAERAVSVSGDDIKTITHYYADPAQPNIGDLMITDLL